MTDTQQQLPIDDASDSAVDEAVLDQVVGGTTPVDSSTPALFKKCAPGTH